MPNVSDTNLSEFFYIKIKELLMEKYPEECGNTITKEKFEELFLRLEHENDKRLEWEKATSVFGGSLDEHLDFQTDSQIDRSVQRMDKFLFKFSKK